VTDDAVYTSGGFGHVACCDRESREIRWMEHLEETYGGEDPGFGWSASPLVLDDVARSRTSGAATRCWRATTC
jgi:hypothetical protein